jgi:ParB family chromosome partitioning protein
MQRRLRLSDITPNPDQPRKTFEPKALDELAASIRENGLLQPITVRPIRNHKEDEPAFEIIAGERRWRAHCRLVELGHEDFATVLCNVKDMDDLTRDIAAIIENLQRVDVRPIEEARAFQRMLDLGMAKEELAKKLGRQVWRIDERTRLLNLEPTLLHLYESGNLPQEAASEISRLHDHEAQRKIAKLVSSGALSGYKAIRTAVDAVIDAKTQADIFGDAAPKVSEEDVQTINRMEAKIETMAKMAAAGWKDGECIVATKVSRDRARLMADKLKAMRDSLAHMERELRMAAAQADVVLEAA